MTHATSLSSDQLIIDVEAPFRVFAGPGAGKTHWLVKHIQNVTARSPHLHAAARIAVISFTNVASDEVARRLGPGMDHVEVSTIHGFLYRNVVKPYLHLVVDPESGHPLFDYAAVDGHDDHMLNYKRVSTWLGHLGLGKRLFAYISGDGRDKVDASLLRVRWEWGGGNDEWVLGSPAWQFRLLPKAIRGGLLDYKKRYWQDGHLDHDDVLRFAHLLLTEYPLILDHLAARFPYVFVDEFQDTRPMQAEVVRWMADRGVTVGVIGDAEQSVYGFNGAEPEQFLGFDLPGVIDFVIEGNRRSTDRIVEVLNRVRSDEVEQRGTREVSGEHVIVVVGDVNSLAEHIAAGDDAPTFLAWKNDTVREFKRACGTSGRDLWADFNEVDSPRARFFEAVAAALVHDARGRPDEAIRTLLKSIRPRAGDLRKPLKSTNPKDPVQRRALAVDLLVALRSEVEALSSLTLKEVYDWLDTTLQSGSEDVRLTGVKKGRFLSFAEGASFGELINSVDVSELVGDARTIHKAKGAEFGSVIVRLEDPGILGCLSGHDELEPEVRRTVYVGLSRARDRLTVSVDSIDEQLEAMLDGLGISVLRLVQNSSEVPSFIQGSLNF